MKGTSELILLCSIIMILMVAVAQGRRTCVRCESSNNDACGEDLTQEQIDSQTRECDDVSENRCMKTKVRAMRTSWTAKNGRLEVATVKISRFCGQSINYPSTGCYYSTGKGGDSWVCSCESDKCNSSSKSLLSIFILACALLIQYIL